MTQATTRRRERGFSMIEMLVTLSILTIVLGLAFMQLGDAQKKYKSEETKIDLAQETRAFLDAIARDLHQAGYPTASMFDSSQPNVEGKAAAGLVNMTDTELQFEGDVDGDGTVDSVHYRLVADGSGKCPCTLTRSQGPKGGAEYPNLALQYVVNSSSSSPWQLSGTAPNASGTLVSDDTLYAAYKKPSVFQALDKDGNITDYASARIVRVTINVLAPNVNMDTRTRPVVSMTINARVGNKS